MNDVVLLFEHPPTARETSVVVMAKILKVHETNLPQSCKQTNFVLVTMTTKQYRAVAIV